MRLSLSIAVLIAILGIATAGRVGLTEEARANAQDAQIVLAGAALCQPALLSAPHPLPPPCGSKQLAHLAASSALLADPSVSAMCLIATPSTAGRPVCISARAARAPPFVRS